VAIELAQDVAAIVRERQPDGFDSGLARGRWLGARGVVETTGSQSVGASH